MTKLLFLGILGEGTGNCFTNLTFNIVKGIISLTDYHYDIMIAKANTALNLPKVDFVIYIVYSPDNNDINEIRKQTNAIKICSLREIIHPLCDYSFVWNNYEKKKIKEMTILPYAVNKNLLKITQKEKGSILIDHYWINYLNTEKDWTHRIEEWVAPLASNHTIYRFVNFKNEHKDLKSFEKPIFHANYYEYLYQTQHIETFIITHKESWGWQIFDMLARGTRVFSAAGMLPKQIINDFNISVFKNKKQLLELLEQPIDDSELINNREKFVNFDKIAEIIHQHFERWKNGNK